jgi:hypothetical protein
MPRGLKLLILSVSCVVIVVIVASFAYHEYVLQSTKSTLQRRVIEAPNPIALTAQLERYRKTPAGGGVLLGETVVAIKGDGSSVASTAWIGNGGKMVNEGRRLELSDGTSAQISDDIRTVTALKVPDAQKARVLNRYDPRSKCAARIGEHDPLSSPVQGRKMLGYDTVGYVLSSGNPRISVWMAPALGCFEMFREEESLDEAKRIVEAIETEAVKIVLGEPKQDLFQIPSSYDHVSFSEHFKRGLEKENSPVPADFRSRFAAEDRMYEQFKQ